jgi:hypothetical protein
MKHVARLESLRGQLGDIQAQPESESKRPHQQISIKFDNNENDNESKTLKTAKPSCSELSQKFQ